jgi:serine/threonine protein phosphatase PrpC
MKDLIEWGVAMLALPGQTESGDRYVVKPGSNNVLVAAVDGLGHGAEAAAAAKIAVEQLESYAHETVISLVNRCHIELKKTRGVVMTLASFNGQDSTMTWLGVGDVEGILFHADAQANPRREAVMQRGGVVGYQLPSLGATVIPVMPGDLLIFATDGVNGGFADNLNLSDHPQQIADDILAKFNKGTDDALVLVSRYLGEMPWKTIGRNS